jgi:hypothetical protein
MLARPSEPTLWSQLGPPTSTMSLRGAPTVTLPSAAGTSSAAMGWISTGGTRDDVAIGGGVGDALCGLEELRRVEDGRSSFSVMFHLFAVGLRCERRLDAPVT